MKEGRKKSGKVSDQKFSEKKRKWEPVTWGWGGARNSSIDEGRFLPARERRSKASQAESTKNSGKKMRCWRGEGKSVNQQKKTTADASRIREVGGTIWKSQGFGSPVKISNGKYRGQVQISTWLRGK